jgi:CRISPR-associated protein Csx17
VGGVLSGFRYGRPAASLDDLTDLATGRLDDQLLSDYLKALILLNWSGSVALSPAGAAQTQRPQPTLRMPHELGLIAPFFGAEALQLRLNDDDESERDVLLRPGQDWIPRLIAGHVHDVAADARRRMRIAGIRCLPGPTTHLDGQRVAATLLAPLTRRTRQFIVRAVAALPPPARIAVEGEPA